MRTTLTVIGSILALLGVIWFFQGINVLPGSFMTGQTKWAVYGGASFVMGIALIGWALRMRR